MTDVFLTLYSGSVFHSFFTSFPQFIHILFISCLFMSLSEIHASVLPKECFELLNGDLTVRHIDATLGLGGHALLFLENNEGVQLLGFDQDESARELAKQRLDSFSDRLNIIPQNFETIGDYSNFHPTSILFDIGVSSLQFDDAQRGFSFRFDAPLDMRMNQDQSLTASEIVNTWKEEDLIRIFYEYGEEPLAKKIAKRIVERRVISPFQTTQDLSSFLEEIKPSPRFRKKQGGGHPAALVFQSLRIAVNRELEVLKKAIRSSLEILSPGGRLGIISFHSLEDRIVKQIFDEYAPKKKRQKYPADSQSPEPFELITKKPVTPSEEELKKNSRSRSAKLRVIQKNDTNMVKKS